MWRGFIFQIFLLCVGLAGCQFVELAQDNKEMNKFSAISGRIIKDKTSDNPVVVTLFSKQRELLNAKLIESEDFLFYAPPGNYFVFAFEDTNRDFLFHPGEPAGYHGDPTPIVLRIGADRADIRIKLRRDLVIPDPEESDSGRPDPGNREFPKLWVGRKNIGPMAVLEDRRFGRQFAKMGTWQPIRFTVEVGPGLFLLEPYDPNKIPVLFIHGINGTPLDWRTIIESLDRRRFQPWILSYASGLPLEANAKYMQEAVTQLWFKYGFENLFLVAHSMGGLVSQGFINRYRIGSGRYLKLFVTLSTPWAGHDSAQFAVDFAPAVVPAWRDMAPASRFLTALRKSHLPEELSYHLLFSYRGSGFPSTVANDGAVTVASQLEPAAQARAKRIYGFDNSHTNILLDEAVIRLLKEILAKARKGAV